MEKLLTIKEIAQRLGAPEPSVRYYKTKIGNFLPGIGSGKRRRYKQEAVEIMAEVISKVNQGIGLDEIYKQLLANKPLQSEGISFDFSKIVQELIIKIKEELKLAEEIGALKKENEILQSKLDELPQTDSQTFENERASYTDKISALEKEIENLKNDLIEKDNTAQALKDKIKECENSITEHENLKEKLSLLEKEVEDYKKIIERQKDAIFQLRDELAKRQI